MTSKAGSTLTVPESARTPDEALQRLMDGNRRWVDGELAHPNRSVERRAELTAGQSPFATVFSCIDSRVPAEIIFDCGLGDLAVVRTGAHVLDEAVILGSIQFATELLGTPLLLVLGHQACGAVTAAIQALNGGDSPDSALGSIVETLRPAYEATGGQDVEATVKAHTKLTVRALSALLPAGSTTRIVGGYYSLDTGAVSILD
jgi:carbonic anhydrase